MSKPNEEPKSLAECLEYSMLAPDRWLIVKMADNDDYFVQTISKHRRDPSGQFDHNDLTIMLDLPLNGLTPEQHANAEAWFRANGVEFPTEDKCYVGTVNRTAWFCAWQLDCGAESSRVIEKMRQVMTAVYGVTEGKIVVEMGDFE